MYKMEIIDRPDVLFSDGKHAPDSERPSKVNLISTAFDRCFTVERFESEG